MENTKFTFADVLKILWIVVKAAVVIFAIFQASNVTVLYQGF